jgi:TPR repeat protein
MSFGDTLGRKLSPVHISRLSVGVVIALLLPVGSGLAGALEDCATAYDRRNYAAAVQLCRPLAEHGDARAQFSLGGMYYNGQGVQQDYPEAAKWTRKAAEQGYTPAQADLGVLYWNGQGVPQDVVLAYMWLSLAAAHEPDAVRRRDLAASQMTSDEIAAAQQLARDWKPTTPTP